MNHLMKLTLLGGLALTACNNNEFAYVATYVANPESDGETPPSCTFDPGADATVTINLDVARSSSLDLVAGVRNNLEEVDIAVDQMSTNAADRIKIPRAITPLRFDFRWECESTGFTGGIGPIILPARRPGRNGLRQVHAGAAAARARVPRVLRGRDPVRGVLRRAEARERRLRRSQRRERSAGHGVR